MGAGAHKSWYWGRWLINMHSHQASRQAPCPLLSLTPGVGVQDAGTVAHSSQSLASVLLGELRSMALAIPGVRGIFSQLQLALKLANQHQVRIHKPTPDAIKDLHVAPGC